MGFQSLLSMELHELRQLYAKAVKLVEIPKFNGGKRPLGIPTIEDRIAQMAVVNVIEPLIEPCFYEDSFGYRLHRSAHDAIAKAERRGSMHGF